MERMKLRKALEKDVFSFLELKARLPLPAAAATSQNGFLIGSDAEAYRHFIKNDVVWVAEDEKENVAGFSIVLRDHSFRESQTWKNLADMKWISGSTQFPEKFNICFFEQLAFVNDFRSRAYGKNLGLKALAEALLTHQFAMTTVVKAPVYNQSSRSFVSAAGFTCIGEVKEKYAASGHIVSDVFIMQRSDFVRQMEGPYRELALKVIGAEVMNQF